MSPYPFWSDHMSCLICQTGTRDKRRGVSPGDVARPLERTRVRGGRKRGVSWFPTPRRVTPRRGEHPYQTKSQGSITVTVLGTTTLEYTEKFQEIHWKRMTTHDNLHYTNIESCRESQAPPLTDRHAWQWKTNVAKWVSFDLNVSYSSWWGYSLRR